MTLEDIINRHNLSRNKYTISKGNEIKIPVKKYKYIEVCIYYYDSEDNPELNTWIDVEGIGYGWIWCGNKLRSKFEFLQRRAIRKFALGLLKIITNDTEIISFNNDGVYIYGYIPDENPTVYTQIRLSDKTLYF